MAAASPASPEAYIAGLAPDRAEAISSVRAVILDHLPDGYEETISFGMISYVVPLSRYPTTYNRQPLQYAALASQKNYMSVYLNCLYTDEVRLEEFRRRFSESSKKLDMGKSCVRFRSLEHLPLAVLADEIAGTSVDEFIALYERGLNRP